MILEKYCEAINKADAEMMASLFAEECYFSAGGGRKLGAPDHVCKSRQEVLEYFKRNFSAYKMTAEIKRVNAASMEYDIIIGNRDWVSPCVGLVTLNKDGLITELIVRPR